MEIGAHTSLEFAKLPPQADEEHIILGCPSQDLTNLRAHFQHLFSSAPPSRASRLRDFMNQDDVLGIAKHVSLQLSCPRRQ
eukprot:598197-Pelagomonas_calceolata.AAC.1